MNDPVIAVLFGLALVIGIMCLATMTAVIGALDRIKKLEDKTADPDPDPVHTMIVESQKLQARLIAQEMERMTSADE